MEFIIEILGELLNAALICKKRIYYILFFILLCGIFGYVYYTS
jgi:hypothetical protein